MQPQLQMSQEFIVQALSPHFTVPPSVMITTLLVTNHAHALLSLPAANDFFNPVAYREAPVSGHKYTGEHVDDFDQESKITITGFLNSQQYRLNVILEKDSRNHALADLVALFGDSVLVGEDSLRGGVRVSDCVHSGHNRHEVLKLMEVGACQVYSTVEGVDQRRVEGAKGELVDDMREVECWVCVSQMQCFKTHAQICLPPWSRCSPNSAYPWPLAVM